ncbi:MAG: helix-turn-helix domain-containing protein [Micrococcales bacterium]|nr:helix-turn-helix domain-containing protein [Micrococcales bacterium]
MRNEASAKAPAGPTLFRVSLGVVLRAARTEQHKTLREVSQGANVSLGYLSEIERGSKEVSSEMLAAICQALNLPLWQVLAMTARAAASDHEVRPVELIL